MSEIRGLNAYFDSSILTAKGFEKVKNVNYGDKILHFNSSDTLTALRAIPTEVGPRYFVQYSDGRHVIYTEGDFIYTEAGGIPVNKYVTGSNNPLNFNINGPIVQPVIDFGNKPKDPFVIDPYIAGALFAYGDMIFDDVNLPITVKQFDEFLSEKCDLDWEIGNEMLFFHRHGSDERITWDELFPDLDIRSMDIPFEYMSSSVINRRKFVRGIFDIGYDPNIIADNVGITVSNERRARSIQKILWSLGVFSRVFYNPNLYKLCGREYELDILGTPKQYPGFFYDIIDIEHMLSTNNRILDHSTDFELTISKIMVMGNGWTHRMSISESTPALYYTGNLIGFYAL